MRKRNFAALLAMLALAACSSRPREFTPTLGVAPTDQNNFDAAYAECKELFVTGKLDTSGRPVAPGLRRAARSVRQGPPQRRVRGCTAGWRWPVRRWC